MMTAASSRDCFHLELAIQQRAPPEADDDTSNWVEWFASCANIASQAWASIAHGSITVPEIAHYRSACWIASNLSTLLQCPLLTTTADGFRLQDLLALRPFSDAHIARNWPSPPQPHPVATFLRDVVVAVDVTFVHSPAIQSAHIFHTTLPLTPQGIYIKWTDQRRHLPPSLSPNNPSIAAAITQSFAMMQLDEQRRPPPPKHKPLPAPALATAAPAPPSGPAVVVAPAAPSAASPPAPPPSPDVVAPAAPSAVSAPPPLSSSTTTAEPFIPRTPFIFDTSARTPTLFDDGILYVFIQGFLVLCHTPRPAFVLVHPGRGLDPYNSPIDPHNFTTFDRFLLRVGVTHPANPYDWDPSTTSRPFLPPLLQRWATFANCPPLFRNFGFAVCNNPGEPLVIAAANTIDRRCRTLRLAQFAHSLLRRANYPRDTPAQLLPFANACIDFNEIIDLLHAPAPQPRYVNPCSRLAPTPSVAPPSPHLPPATLTPPPTPTLACPFSPLHSALLASALAAPSATLPPSRNTRRSPSLPIGAAPRAASSAQRPAPRAPSPHPKRSRRNTYADATNTAIAKDYTFQDSTFPIFQNEIHANGTHFCKLFQSNICHRTPCQHPHSCAHCLQPNHGISTCQNIAAHRHTMALLRVATADVVAPAAAAPPTTPSVPPTQNTPAQPPLAGPADEPSASTEPVHAPEAIYCSRTSSASEAE